MSFIPNSAMPHAVADDDQADVGRPETGEQPQSLLSEARDRASAFLAEIDWEGVSRTALKEARQLGRLAGDFGQRGYGLARRRPREAAAAGAAGAIAVLAGLGYAAWRSRSRRPSFA